MKSAYQRQKEKIRESKKKIFIEKMHLGFLQATLPFAKFRDAISNIKKHFGVIE